MGLQIPAQQGDAHDWDQSGEGTAEDFRLLGAILLAQPRAHLAPEEPAHEPADEPGQHAKYRRIEEEGGVPGENRRRQAHGEQSANGAHDGSSQRTQIKFTYWRLAHLMSELFINGKQKQRSDVSNRNRAVTALSLPTASSHLYQCS